MESRNTNVRSDEFIVSLHLRTESATVSNFEPFAFRIVKNTCDSGVDPLCFGARVNHALRAHAPLRTDRGVVLWFSRHWSVAMRFEGADVGAHPLHLLCRVFVVVIFEFDFEPFALVVFEDANHCADAPFLRGARVNRTARADLPRFACGL